MIQRILVITFLVPQFSSVTQSCMTLCNPMDCSTLGLPVHHQLPELTQTLVHGVGDAIQPSHPLWSPSPPALNLSQHQGLFKWVSSWHPLPFLNPACISGSSWFMYYWNLVWRILRITLLHKHNCIIVGLFFGIAFLLGLEWKLTFSSPVTTAQFSKFANILSAELLQHHLLRFEIAGILSPPLALFAVMLPKAHLTSHSKMSGSGWVTTASWLFGSLRPFLFLFFYCSSVYSCHLFLISFASNRSILFLYSVVPIFARNVPLVFPIFLKSSLVFPIQLFSSISLHCSLKKAFFISPCCSLELCIQLTHSYAYIFIGFMVTLFSSIFTVYSKVMLNNFHLFHYNYLVCRKELFLFFPFLPNYIWMKCIFLN